MGLKLINSETVKQEALNQIRVLLISTQRMDFQRVSNMLQVAEKRRYELTWCSDLAHAPEAIGNQLHDVILLDFGLEQAGQLLELSNQQSCKAPILVITDVRDDELDQQVIKAGAADYLVKGAFNAQALERAIRYALDRKDTELKLSRLAHYDALSGVPNRVLFKDRLQRAIQRAERGQQGVALLFLDFDGFKSINDTYGHDAGDRLIELIGERLMSCMRKTDSVARLGGDEFTVVLEDINTVADIVNVARKIIATVAKPFPIAGHQIVAGCSIGIAQYPQAGRDFDTLLKHADTAMYQAKQVPGNAYKFYNERMNDESAQQQKFEEELQAAVKNGEMKLYFQPRISLVSNKIEAFECLLRWQHPSRGILAPADFLPLAERTGNIVEIGNWVLEEACRTLRGLDQLDHPGLSMVINLSARQLSDKAFISSFASTLEESGLAPERLELDIAEATLNKQYDNCAAALRLLAHLGVKLAVDDFGTSASSLMQLQRLPLHAVKIDQSLVQNIERDVESAVVRSLLGLAKSMTLNVVAEGVENIEQVRFLKQIGVDAVQGYYFASPLSYDKLIQLLKADITVVP
jgi:diguanylate cyclase (GGDEF)-like protein